MLDTDSCYVIKTALVDRLKRMDPDRVVRASEIVLRRPNHTLLKDPDSVRNLGSVVLSASIEELFMITFCCDTELLRHPFDVKKTVADMKAYVVGQIGAQIEEIRLDLNGRNLNDALVVGGLRIRPNSKIVIYDGRLDIMGILLLSGAHPEPVTVDFWYEEQFATVRFPTCATVADAKTHLGLHVFYILQDVVLSL
jgi:hypothetical protein